MALNKIQKQFGDEFDIFNELGGWSDKYVEWLEKNYNKPRKNVRTPKKEPRHKSL